MRVVKQGEIELVCQKCHCTLAVTASDIKEDDSGHGKPYFVTCGGCRALVHMVDQQIPAWMQRQMLEIGA